MNKKEKEFDTLQRELVQHKYNYYVLSKPTIPDDQYDQLELRSFKLAKQLGFRADRWEDPEENEKDHIHWMVGFNDKNPYAIEMGLKR